MNSLRKSMMFAMVGALAMAGCAPIRTVPIPQEIEPLEVRRTPSPFEQTFQRNRLRDQKRRADKSHRLKRRREHKRRIGGRKRGR